MEQINLKAEKRDLLGKKVKSLRRNSFIPGIVYGRNFKCLPISINNHDFSQVNKIAGEATLINIVIENQEPLTVLIRGIQKNPVTDEIQHLDFYKVDMSKTLQTEIPLTFTGISPAVEDLEGNFIAVKDAIKVECLPNKLVSEIQVDISNLKTFEDLIHIKDLNIPEGIEVLDDAEEIVCQVTAPMSEEELKALEEEAAASTEKAQIESIEAEAEKEKAEKAEAEGAGEETPQEAPAPAESASEQNEEKK